MTTAEIRIFNFLDTSGTRFSACLCAHVDLNFHLNPQYSIVEPADTSTNPGTRLYQRLSCHLSDLPSPRVGRFYMRLDYRRYTRADAGLADDLQGKLVVTVTGKRMAELTGPSVDAESFDSANLKMLEDQGIIRVVEQVRQTEKSRFVLVECLLEADELMRHCEGCRDDEGCERWEVPAMKDARYKFCGRCTCQKVAYCSKRCQKGMCRLRLLMKITGVEMDSLCLRTSLFVARGTRRRGGSCRGLVGDVSELMGPSRLCTVASTFSLATIEFWVD
jgi:hypothetical protein